MDGEKELWDSGDWRQQIKENIFSISNIFSIFETLKTIFPTWSSGTHTNLEYEDDSSYNLTNMRRGNCAVHTTPNKIY